MNNVKKEWNLIFLFFACMWKFFFIFLKITVMKVMKSGKIEGMLCMLSVLSMMQTAYINALKTESLLSRWC